MRAGVPMLRDVIAPVLLLFDAGEHDKVFFRIISDQQWTLIEGRVQRLFDHKICDDPSPDVISRLKINAAEQVRNYLTSQGLTVLDSGGSRSITVERLKTVIVNPAPGKHV